VHRAEQCHWLWKDLLPFQPRSVKKTALLAEQRYSIQLLHKYASERCALDSAEQIDLLVEKGRTAQPRNLVFGNGRVRYQRRQLCGVEENTIAVSDN